MVQRLGNVLGLTGCLIGGALVAIGLYALTLPGARTSEVALLLLTPGVVIVLLGSALWYVLAGAVHQSVGKSEQTSTSADTVTPRQPFHYSLHVRVEPQWAEIIRKVVGLAEDERTAFGEKISQNLHENCMLNRNYVFTEYFDAASGMTIKYQRTDLLRESRWDSRYNFVDEFGDAGYLFGSSSPLMPESDRQNYSIHVTEHGIRTDCFYKDFDVQTPWSLGDHLFSIPTNAIIEFLLETQLRFTNVGSQQIVKWPDKIEEELRKSGIRYEAFGDHPPDLMNLEEEDPKFFVNFGRPQIAASRPLPWESPAFVGIYCYFEITFQAYTPERARSESRLAYTSVMSSRMFS